MKKAVIFDFDYTLGDSAEGIVKSANYALAEMGSRERDAALIRGTIGLSLEQTYSALTGDGDTSHAREFARLFKEQADEVMVDSTEFYDGAEATLRTLKERGYTVGIVTTKFHYRIDAILAKFRCAHLVDVIVGAEDVDEVKPSPEGLLHAIDQMETDKAHVLYVGDSTVDALTAESAGVPFAAVLTGTKDRGDFAGFDCAFIADRVSDILDFLEI